MGSWLLLLVAAALPCANAQEPDAIPITDLQHQLLREPVEFLIAGEELELADLTVSEAGRAFRPLTADNLNQGISGETFWLRMRLNNAGDEPRGWVLNSDIAYLDNLRVYYRDYRADPADRDREPGSLEAENFERVLLSDQLPFDARPVGYRKLAFAHTTGPGQQTELYLQLGFDKADSVSLNFHLWDAELFSEHVKKENLVFGAYYGALITLIVISLVLTAVLRQFTYFYYAVFLVSTILMWALLNGLGFQYLWPESVFWQNEGFHIVFLAFSFFAFQFTRAFLRTRTTLPRINLLLVGFQAIIILAVVLRLAGVWEAVLNLSFLMLALLAVLPLIGWLAWRRGMTHARWFCLAWLIYSFTLLLSLGSAYTSAFSWGMHSLVYTQAASIVESALLLVALAERLMQIDLDRRRAVDLAHRDELTGLGNRRQLIQHYRKLKARFNADSSGESTPVYLILIDLDHFKSINDIYGHQAGDYVLQQVAELLLRCSRSRDACTRYGGEEFAMLVQAPDLDAAWLVAERIRSQFAESPTEYKGRSIMHTLSIGLIPALTSEGTLATQEVLARADTALYEAKAGGRNRTVVYSASENDS